jgi:hypothetical protein
MKRLVWLALLFSVAGNAYLFYLLVDAGVSLDDARSEVDVLWNRRKETLKILQHDWVGKSVDELSDLEREAEAAGIPLGTEGENREVGDFIFYVERGTVVDVRDLDSENHLGEAHSP